MRDTFRTFSTFGARIVGSGWSFLIAIAAIIATGYIYGFSDRWKLNAGLMASLLSLLVLIVLQRSQNHNDKATHIKLDELITAIEGARDETVSVEDRPEREMDKIKESKT